MSAFIKKYFGDKSFYKMLLAVAIPIMVQNGITNLVNLLDNIMVGSLGTEAMSGVSIVNQFVFIFNLIVFGAVSAAGIFTTQYHGNRDDEGVRNTFRFKLLINVVCSAICVAVFLIFEEALIGTFLTGEGDVVQTMEYAKDYLKIIVIGLIPYSISCVYSSTMRETGDPVFPMLVSIAALFTNAALNAILIFGLLGAPALGIKGAAIATVCSRIVEVLMLVIRTHVKSDKYPYIKEVFRSFRIPHALATKIIVKGLPLMANELFWSIAITMRNQAYSTRGLEAVAAQNITSTLYNFMTVTYMALSAALSILVGARLGAGDIEDAKSINRKILTFSIIASVGIAGILCALAPFFPLVYNTSDSVRSLATYMILICAAFLPFSAFAHASYFTLRTGGKIFITIIMDSVFMWVTVVPVSFILANFTAVPIKLLFLICYGIEFLKIIIAAIFLIKGNWAVRLIDGDDDVTES